MILRKILELKKEEVELRKKEKPLSFLKESKFYHFPTRDFKKSLLQPGISLIAELKKASPSAGVIKEDFCVEELSQELEKGGACALSILTEKNFFQGDLSYLERAKISSKLPLLRKDFIIDAYQIFETRAYGGDALLFITSLLEKEKLRDFILISSELSLFPLVEVHSEKEIEVALEAGAEIIGINQRDLKTLKVKEGLAEKLIPFIPPGKVVVAESGIKSFEQVISLERAGFDGILVGEYLMRGNPSKQLQKLLSF